jgi:hypothetical protein
VKESERVKLLFGPYQAPALRQGDRATCLYRGCEVIVTSWTAAPIPWPRCCRAEGRGHPSLLVNEELARAIRNESALAVRYWWRVSGKIVWRWRRALAVDRKVCPGSQRLIRAVDTSGGILD